MSNIKKEKELRKYFDKKFKYNENIKDDDFNRIDRLKSLKLFFIGLFFVGLSFLILFLY